MTSTRNLRGYDVVIVAVLKGALCIEEYGHLTCEEEVRGAGGVDAGDRIEIAPFLPKEGRLSFVTSDPRAIDLEAFRYLAVPAAAPGRTPAMALSGCSTRYAERLGGTRLWTTSPAELESVHAAAVAQAA